VNGEDAGERGSTPVVLVGRGIAVVDDHQLGDGAAALAEAARLLGPEGFDVGVDLARYAELVEGTR
jgi:hypothetical protein